ncbi:hypothetical protein [Archangium violaceum]|uniref:Dickkopf N-terminal cysteine-rich domain-containing protein n=1 Tax=Archangium violaceum Cb vi76 TaxID=1406225 RepID=A0A084SRM4_9BACT|nr:hypothetical protein [Archangium violaceum]KFA91109.1 hypothetical protein Q664_24055 [Archangium violaceum Cb vi76]
MYRYRTALAILGLWLAACSSGVKQEDFDAALAEAVCEKYVRCGVSHDEDSCKRNQLQGFIGQRGLTQYREDFRAGRIRYDATAASACLEKIRTGTCDAHPLSSRRFLPGVGMSVDCRFLFGEVEDGEPCHGSGECGDRSACTSVSLSSCGTCQPRRAEGMPSASPTLCEEGLVYSQSTCRKPLAEGESCADSGASGQELCEQGLICDQDTQRCRRPAAQGEACGSWGSGCHWTLTCIDDTCQPPRGLGADCTAEPRSNPSFPIFDSSQCQQELFCDAEPGAPGKCRELLEEGASCRDFRACDRGLSCDGLDPSSTQPGTCRRLAGQDEDCTERFCDGRFYCAQASNTCQPRRQFGEPCADEPTACVLGTTCAQGTCSGPDPSCRP